MGAHKLVRTVCLLCRQLAKTYVDQAMHLYEEESSRQFLRDLAKVSVANSVSIAQVS